MVPVPANASSVQPPRPTGSRFHGFLLECRAPLHDARQSHSLPPPVNLRCPICIPIFTNLSYADQ